MSAKVAGQGRPVLVTGGSGFIGSHVADALSEAGFAVKVFDITPSPYLRDDQTMQIGDLMDADALAEAAKGCFALFHIAGQANIDTSPQRLRETLDRNVIGTMNALEAARLGGCDRFLFSSSVYVLSRHGSFYAMSKRAAEDLIQTYHDNYGLDFTILRYGSVYGRRADRHNTIHRLVKEALVEGKVTYHGHASAVREYIHVGDVARLTVSVLDQAYRNGHFVLTGTERLGIREVIQLVSEIAPEGVSHEFSEAHGDSHYVMTPYTFQPNAGKKIIATEYTDLAQGILDVFHELHAEVEPAEQSDGS